MVQTIPSFQDPEAFRPTGQVRYYNGVLQFCSKGDRGTILWQDVPSVDDMKVTDDLPMESAEFNCVIEPNDLVVFDAVSPKSTNGKAVLMIAMNVEDDGQPRFISRKDVVEIHAYLGRILEATKG